MSFFHENIVLFSFCYNFYLHLQSKILESTFCNKEMKSAISRTDIFNFCLSPTFLRLSTPAKKKPSRQRKQLRSYCDLFSTNLGKLQMSEILLKIKSFLPARKLQHFHCQLLYHLHSFAKVAGVADFCLPFFFFLFI